MSPVAPDPLPAPPPRSRRRWPFFVGGLLLGGALVFAALLTPTVQAWLVRQAFARQPGWRMNFEKFGVGPTGLDARGLDFAMPGLTATSAPITVQVLPSRLLRGEFNVAQVDVQRLRIEFTPAQLQAAAAGATPAAPFPGILALLRAPLPWVVQSTQLDAEIAVNDGGRSVVVSRLILRGGGLRAGQTGEFTYEFSAASIFLPPGPDNIVKSRGTLRVTQDDAHGIARLELKGDLTLPRYGPVTLPPGAFTLTLAATPTGETYAAALRLGDGGTFDFSGQLDPVRARVAATLGFHLDQSLAAALLPTPPPTAALNGTVTLGLDLKTNALDATLAGDLAARDFKNLRPELAAIDALTGKLDAAFTLRAGRAELARAALTLNSATSPFAVTAALTAPVAFPTTTPLTGRATVTGLPAIWANPALGPTAQFTAGAFSGEATFTLDPADLTLRLAATRPAEFGPVTVTSPRLPTLPPFTLRVTPRLTASPARVTFTCDDLTLTSPGGDRITVNLSAAHDLATATTHATGQLAGALPTLLSAPGQALPFTLGARWDATIAPAGLRLAALEFTARLPNTPVPALSLALQHPIDLSATGELSSQRDLDLLKLEIHDLPLAWVSKWLPHRDLTGVWAAGESVLRRTPTGPGFLFTTRTPWTFTALGATVGGKTLFRGRAQLAPEFTLADDESVTARLTRLDLSDLDGNRLQGDTTFTWRPRAKTFTSALSLDATLPALPGSRDTFGPLTASLRTQASTADGKVSQIENFRFEVRRAAGPLLTLDSAQPFYFVSKPNGEIVFVSVAPLTVETAAIPLAWLRPWLPADTTLTGTLEPTKMLLVAEPQKFNFRATQPLRVTDFNYTRLGVPRLTAATASFYPGIDLGVYHQLQPDFQFVYFGRLYATDGSFSVADARALEFEAAVGFVGNDRDHLTDGGDLSARLDFAALRRIPELAANGLPAAGELVLRANAKNLRNDTPEFYARLSGVPSADGRRTLPPLEVTAHGRVDGRARAIHFDVTTLFATTPRPTDATFALDLALGPDSLPLASTLRSQFLDVGELLALAEAFTPPRPAASPTPAATAVAAAPTAPLPPPVYTPMGEPFWSKLRGHFDLDLAAVQMLPYRIDGVRGRLDLTERAFTLSGLAGEMFAGRWHGDIRIGYEPGAPAGDHVLTGKFDIEQFETARAIQTVFPNDYGSLDARLDLTATVRGAGYRWWQLLDGATGEFALTAQNGVARLQHPQLGTASTVLALAGTVGFSAELRALGRLLKKFAEMPVEHLRVTGARDAAGNLTLGELRLDSPQARILGRGQVPADAATPLVGRKLNLSLELQAKDEMAVILGNMKLLEKQPQPDGFQRMKQPFLLGGEVGKPDPSPLYDLLARAVDGSKGTWSLIMRKVQKEVEKPAPPPTAKKTAALP